MPSAHQRVIRRVLLHAAHLAGDKVRKSISRRRRGRAGESEDAVVVQIRREHALVEPKLSSIEDIVLAFGRADHVAERVEV